MTTCTECGTEFELHCRRCGRYSSEPWCTHCVMHIDDQKCPTCYKTHWKKTTGYDSEVRYILSKVVIIVPIVLILFIALLAVLGVFD